MELPECPHHGRTDRWRDGTYGVRRRQRYRCRPERGARAHVFTERLPRLLGSGQRCDDCERLVPRHEGPTTPRRFDHPTRLVAAALVELGRGATYRATAERIRVRDLQPGRAGGRSAVSREPNLVADWVEVFGPVVSAPFAPAGPYRALVIDDLPFWVAGRFEPARPAYHVLGVLGIGTDGRSELVALRAAPDRSRASWIAVLAALPGPAPERIVTDEASGALSAIRAVWTGPSRPRTWYCHHHLERNLASLIPDGGRAIELRVALGQAFGGSAPWARFAELGRAHGGPRLVRWLDRLEPVVADQVSEPAGPRSTGALEHALRVVKTMLYDRRGRFTNRARLDRLLELIRLEINGQASPTVYARLVLDHLASQGGWSDPRHQILDPRGQPSLW